MISSTEYLVCLIDKQLNDWSLDQNTGHFVDCLWRTNKLTRSAPLEVVDRSDHSCQNATGRSSNHQVFCEYTYEIAVSVTYDVYRNECLIILMALGYSNTTLPEQINNYSERSKPTG